MISEDQAHSDLKTELSLEQILERYYATEQYMELSSFFDTKWEVKLGDGINDYSDCEICLTLPEVKTWLLERLP